MRVLRKVRDFVQVKVLVMGPLLLVKVIIFWLSEFFRSARVSLSTQIGWSIHSFILKFYIFIPVMLVHISWRRVVPAFNSEILNLLLQEFWPFPDQSRLRAISVCYFWEQIQRCMCRSDIVDPAGGYLEFLTWLLIFLKF